MIIYLILSLLFVVSVKLHVHLGENATQSPHGEAVAISIPGADLVKLQEFPDEVQVGVDQFTSKILKNIVTALIFVAAFFLLLLPSRYCVRRFRESDAPDVTLPFAGTPPLRAPPL